MKIVTVIGARPQFVKASVISHRFIELNIEEIIIHTGQHFNDNMSKVFFEELEIPAPKYNLNINSLSHGAMTGRMIEEIEKVLIIENPNIVLVYGDTTSTLAAALAAKKLHLPIAHIEAGLRSFNDNMPEEINRILTDRISDFLFCPTETAIKNLKNEGFDKLKSKIIYTGDVMYDVALNCIPKALKPNFDIPSIFFLVTIHRAENINDNNRLTSIFAALNEINKKNKLILLLHPSTQKKMAALNILEKYNDIQIVPPATYFEMIYLLQHCSMVITDSGGLQKEAFFFEKKCVTLRDETEWVELVKGGFNVIAGSNSKNIVKKVNSMLKKQVNFQKKLYGDGNASKLITSAIINFLN